MNDEERYAINHSYEIAVRNLNSRGWELMTQDDKLHDLQAIEDKNAMDQNRLACTVIAESLENGVWGYQQGMNIVVNESELNNRNIMEQVDTLFHEGSHARDWQAQFFNEIKGQYFPGQLEERLTPIPNPDKDMKGYLNHPAEVAAREAGSKGVEKVENDKILIEAMDQQMREGQPKNQILQTYEYLALDIAAEKSGAKTVNLQDDSLEQIGTGQSGVEENMNGEGLLNNQILQTYLTQDIAADMSGAQTENLQDESLEQIGAEQYGVEENMNVVSIEEVSSEMEIEGGMDVEIGGGIEAEIELFE